MSDLAARLAAVDQRIGAAARACGRDVAEITRIVVTKFHPPALISELHSLGVRDLGENRPQELAVKSDGLGLPDVRWHAIGQVQTNKAALVRRHAAVIHTVDRERLVAALEGDGPARDVLVQVNLTDDPNRGGVAPAGLEALADRVLRTPTLVLRGIMAVAPLDEEPESAFARLAAHAETLRSLAPDARWISAGMSDDLEQAIQYGATHLRIGSAITGPRPARG